MEIKRNELYEAPAITVVEVKLDGNILVGSGLRSGYGSEDETDDD